MKKYPREIRQWTFNFALGTLRCCKRIAEIEKEYIATRQLSRSATSVGANVREARNSVSRNDFINKLAIAQKECDESIYWLELLNEFTEYRYEELAGLKSEASEILLVLSTIIIKTKTAKEKIR